MHWAARLGGKRGYAFGLAAGLVLAFAVVALRMSSAGVSAWDIRVAEAAVTARTPPLTVAMWLLTVVGDTYVMTGLALVVGLAFALWGRPRAAVLFLTTLATGHLLVEAVKLFAHRVRPPGAIALIATPGSYSFPSGHAFVGLAFWVLAAALVTVRLRGSWAKAAVIGGGAVLGLATGASRAYLGVHWASDVLASWALASAWLIAAWAVGLRFAAVDEVGGWRVPRGRALVVAAVLGAVAVALVAWGALADPLLPPIP